MQTQKAKPRRVGTKHGTPLPVFHLPVPHLRRRFWRHGGPNQAGTGGPNRVDKHTERITRGEEIFEREYYCKFAAGPTQFLEKELIEAAFDDSIPVREFD